jgi:membrane protein YdbS with pleckstrin-like domain
MKEEKTNYVGIGAPTLLSIVFTVLKLCGVITWSWWWVLSPIWISVGFTVLVVLLALIVTIISVKVKK